MLAPRSPQSPVRSERGFTLIETLVAMVIALIVTLAAFELLEVTDHQTERATNYLESSQLGNAVMTHIVGELDSACLRYKFVPLLAGKENEITFQDASSTEAEIPLSQIQEREIVWKEKGTVVWHGVARKYGTLTEFRAPATGESKGEYTWGTKSEVKLGTRVMKELTENEKGAEAPIFRYYKYSTTVTDSSELGETSLTEVPSAEVSSHLGEIVSVQIAFRALPTDGKAIAEDGESLGQRSQVAFSFSTPLAESTISGETPCQ
jgi:prepilin-type N-terminal cleavage/methylation domain-containing protein